MTEELNAMRELWRCGEVTSAQGTDRMKTSFFSDRGIITAPNNDKQYSIFVRALSFLRKQLSYKSHMVPFPRR
jgi:hypothetical protein